MSLFFRQSHRQIERGFSAMEILITVAIAGILAVIIFMSFSGARSNQVLKNNIEDVVAVIREAQSKTLAGEGGDQFGVHIQSDRVVLFVGPTYSAGLATNKTLMLDSGIVITSISLTGGGSDIVFARLTGETSQYGSFIIKDSTTTVGQKTVTVSALGLVAGN